MLYRIADAADWLQAQKTGCFASADLIQEGFIHCSELHQVLETARRYYAGHPELRLLEWDEATLAEAGIRVEREWVENRQQYFAHVYGLVPLAAVTRSWSFAVAADGEAVLPPELAEKQ
ncbi:DUF952 domain-containing protein [Hymenobacter taeanensis]|uniref:DUF952 domain-containing protein n=1 Tax=Hymenobacter taeanensis TaxID=2735321 RepID=A0A6M6BDZ8_9BACT|nr:MULTISPECIES: DUF952 domain-containing protein [Hymenobacter]QJX45415.1 DUF952 domain-containing protein [Hymenobacter taeanensis]UOQ81342.1 DUF952 domain-containing protein [Hymenobacter sp. 5414T-23]